MGVRERLRSLFRRGYSRSVSPRRRLPRLEPIRHLSDLDAWIGWWVAVKSGEVVATGRTAIQLVSEMREKNIHGATAQYVPPPADAIKVGLG